MKKGHQGCALSAGRHISVSKVVDHVQPCTLGNGRCMQQLQTVSLTGPVPNGLTMDAHARKRRVGVSGPQRLDTVGDLDGQGQSSLGCRINAV